MFDGTTKSSLAVVAAILIISSAIAESVDSLRMRNDTAQYISVASNITSGFGVSTDVMYYEPHFRSDSFPAPQTIWPPGFPLLIAAVNKFGLDLSEAAVFVACASFLLTTLGIWFLLGGFGVSRIYQVVGCCTWILFSPAWIEVIGGMSGGTAVCLSLFSAAAYIKSESKFDSPIRQSVNLGVAGVLAGLSFSVHYASAFYLVALALVFLLEFGNCKWRQIWSRAAILGATTCGILAIVLWHNYALTGEISRGVGGETEASILDVIYSLFAAVSSQFGINADGHLLSYLSSGAAVMMVGTLLMSATKVANKRKLFAGLGLLTLWLAIGLLGFLIPAFFGGRVRISPRYLSYLAPAALIIAFVVAHRVHQRNQSTKFYFKPAIFAVLLAIILMAHVKQLYHYRSHDDTYNKNLMISQSLENEIAGKSIKTFLLERVNRSKPLFANEPQSLFHILRSPILGVPPKQYSLTSWSTAAVRNLIQKFDVEYVVFLPKFMDTSVWYWSRHPFYEQLETGVVPPWLQLIYCDEDIRIYKVI